MRLTLIIFITILIGIIILNGMTDSISGPTLPNTKATHSVPQSCRKSHTCVLNKIVLSSGINETATLSRFEASWTSMMNTLEKIQRMIDDLRRLVETLHQLTQTFIAVVNELSFWIDQVPVNPNVVSSV